ncbi:unnamed protein product [Ilex paraguariensis]|uniref:F-box domain-containing protein n=1 Tax=Ilex paraguariensis TaxID=185542 RepID=A0ABC8TZK5_9AQUA
MDLCPVQTGNKEKRNDSEDDDNKIPDTVLFMDRISQLPDHLNHKILSFLRGKHVARTSVLSKTWNRIWLTFPVFELRINYDHYIESSVPDPDSYIRYPEEFLFLVDKSLQRRFQQNLDVSVFSLLISFPKFEPLATYMDRWVGVALERNVTKLVLEVYTDPVIWYRVPQTVLSSKSLTILKLYNCRLDNNCVINLSQLRKLSLTHVCLLDQDMFSNLEFKFPLIEDLVIKNCKGMNRNLWLSPGLCPLKNIELSSNKEIRNIEIAATNLQSFLCLGWRPRVISFVGCVALEKLTLVVARITDETFEDIISKLPSLEVLQVISCEYLNRIRISSQKLKELNLQYCDHLSFFEIDTPNLLKIQLRFLDRVRFSLTQHTLHLLKVDVIIRLGNDDLDWFSQLKILLMKSSQSQNFKIAAHDDVQKMLMVHERLSEFQPSLLHGLTDALGQIVISISSKSFEDFILEAFWWEVKNISLIWSRENPKQVLFDIMKMRNEAIIKLGHFEIEDSQKAEDQNPQEIEDNMHPAWKFVLNSHSTALYQTSTYRIRKKLISEASTSGITGN